MNIYWHVMKHRLGDQTPRNIVQALEVIDPDRFGRITARQVRNARDEFRIKQQEAEAEEAIEAPKRAAREQRHKRMVRLQAKLDKVVNRGRGTKAEIIAELNRITTELETS